MFKGLTDRCAQGIISPRSHGMHLERQLDQTDSGALWAGERPDLMCILIRSLCGAQVGAGRTKAEINTASNRVLCKTLAWSTSDYSRCI